MQSKLSVCPGREDIEIKQASEEHKYDVYIGHIGIDFLQRFNSPLVATFMRDPLARMFSMWNQMRRTSGLEIIQGTEKAMAFENWCRSELETTPLLFNQATQWLSYGRDNPLIDIANPANEQMYLLASENLKKFDFVGLTEHYDIFFQDFLELFDLPKVERVHSNYIISDFPMLNDDFIEWFKCVSLFDFKLYSLAQDVAWKIHARNKLSNWKRWKYWCRSMFSIINSLKSNHARF